MRGGAGALSIFGVTFAITCGLGKVHADDRARAVVATVGTAEITAGELEKRMKGVPDFQLATFGKTPDEQRKNFLDQVMVREALLAEGAKARKLDESSAVRERTDETLRAARLLLLKTELAVTPEEVTAFFVENHGRFDSPARVGVYRILCRTREEAAEVLSAAKQSGNLTRWNELARERSVDRATALRGGNLGFLGPNSSSSASGRTATTPTGRWLAECSRVATGGWRRALSIPRSRAPGSRRTAAPRPKTCTA